MHPYKLMNVFILFCVYDRIWCFNWYWKQSVQPSVSLTKSSSVEVFCKISSCGAFLCSVQFCSWKPSDSWRRPWSRVSSGCSPPLRRVCSPASRQRQRFPQTRSAPATPTFLLVSQLRNPILHSAQPPLPNDLGTEFNNPAFCCAVHF